jgi:hypothetical protein
MSTTLKNQLRAPKKIWIGLFIAILGIQSILELGIGLALLFDLPSTLENGFNITYSRELDILGIALGFYLLLLTTLMILSALWTYRLNVLGTTLGIVLGIFLVIFGLYSFFKLGNVEALFGDSVRGLITIVFGYLASKELKRNTIYS